jgi:enterochelin esterase-like enzyme
MRIKSINKIFFYFLKSLLYVFFAFSAGAQAEPSFLPKVDIMDHSKGSKISSAASWVTSPASYNLIQYEKFESKSIGSLVSYHILLPPTYHIQKARRFPVIYWLHGSGPSVKGIPALSEFFANAMETGKMPQAIIVFPNGLPDGMWIDSKDLQWPVESILVDELLPLIDRTYRTIVSREARIIEGFSMGGYGAGRLGLKYSDKFRAISMYGAGPLQQNFLADDRNLKPLELRRRIFSKTYGNDLGYFLSNSPWELAKMHGKSLPLDFRIRIIVGDEDHQVINANIAFHDHLNKLGLKHEFIKVPKIGHRPMDLLRATEDAAMKFYLSVLPQS